VKQITAKGQTVNEAVEAALKELNTTREKVEIKVINEAKKGFLGIFGVKPAMVEVSLLFEEVENNEVEGQQINIDSNQQLQKDPVAETEKFLTEVIVKMGLTIKIEKKQQGRDIFFNLSGEKIAILIGKRGQTLNSLQYLSQLVANRYTDQYINIVIDAENYREKRKETLENLANRLAQKVMDTGSDVYLEPMPSFERKIIHHILSGNRSINTSSTGNEPNRHIVITSSKKRK
jgi:spoIIIJ-associated protein